jgi:hypothetical protein
MVPTQHVRRHVWGARGTLLAKLRHILRVCVSGVAGCVPAPLVLWETWQRGARVKPASVISVDDCFMHAATRNCCAVYICRGIS